MTKRQWKLELRKISKIVGCTFLILYNTNLNSKITDKLRHLSVIFKQTHLFLDIFEICCNHRQMSVEIKIKSHIQQKN